MEPTVGTMHSGSMSTSANAFRNFEAFCFSTGIPPIGGYSWAMLLSRAFFWASIPTGQARIPGTPISRWMNLMFSSSSSLLATATHWRMVACEISEMSILANTSSMTFLAIGLSIILVLLFLFSYRVTGFKSLDVVFHNLLSLAGKHVADSFLESLHIQYLDVPGSSSEKHHVR